MKGILHYPYINLPNTDWTVRNLLYYDKVGTIVPQKFFDDPEKNYDPHMLELVRSELVIPINPIWELENPNEVTVPFLEYLKKNISKFRKYEEEYESEQYLSIHEAKFLHSRGVYKDKLNEDIFSTLVQLKLARRVSDEMYSVQGTTASNLMLYLASVLGHKLNLLPTTSVVGPTLHDINPNKYQKDKREKILTDLIPYPERIDISKLMKFKEKNLELLNTFRNKIELLVLDSSIDTESTLYIEKIKELKSRQNELYTKMNENQLGNILFGSVCGIAGAFQELASTESFACLIGGLPGFITAIHSALKIESPEKVFDQSGLKYLALAEKRITIKRRTIANNGYK